MELDFAGQVDAFTRTLQQKYGLQSEGSTLRNEKVCVKFCDHSTRDRYVSVLASFADDSLFREFAKTKSFFLRAYMEYRGVEKDEVFPLLRSKAEGLHTKAYEIFGFTNFLTCYCDPVLAADRGEMKNFGQWFKQRTIEYNKRFTSDR